MIKIIFLSIFGLILLSGCVVKKRYFGSNSGYINVDENAQHTINNSPKMHKATMRPYQINGIWYEPNIESVGSVFDGIASWYGPNFHLKKTSNGEIYNMNAMTAAHKTLPMNTMLRVDNLDNGKSTVVRINDRGPFVEGRIIDLSNAAAREINMLGRGIANVKITVLGFNAKIATTKEEMEQTSSVGKYLIQVAAFKNVTGANSTKSKLQSIFGKNYPIIIKEGDLNGEAIHRVFVAGFRSTQEATDFKNEFKLGEVMILAE